MWCDSIDTICSYSHYSRVSNISAADSRLSRKSTMIALNLSITLYWNYQMIKGGSKVLTLLTKSRTSLPNSYKGMNQILPFCRGREELSSEKETL